MSYTQVNYGDVEPVNEGLHFLRDPLDCEHVGVSVLECSPGWSGLVHDHADDDHEEVYVLVEGSATVTVDGEDVPLETGDAVRIPPESTRQIQNDEGTSRFVLVGAP